MAVTREFENRSIIYNAFYTPTVKELLIYKKRGLKSVQIHNPQVNQQWESVLQQTNLILMDLKQEQIEMEQKATEEKLSRRAFFTSMQTGGGRS